VNSERPVHLLRRLGAICYDALLLMAVLFIAGLPLPLIPEPVRMETGVRYATFLYMLLVSFVFFGWFWTHGGQTLGMRAWRLRVVDARGAGLDWKLAWRRFTWSMVSWAALGLGFLWSLVDPHRQALHDRLSGTRLVRVPAGSLPPQQQSADAGEQERR
jgi:uncharacterized RDD family membrane protein YckC